VPRPYVLTQPAIGASSSSWGCRVSWWTRCWPS